jgi:hypothetical protein
MAAVLAAVGAEEEEEGQWCHRIWHKTNPVLLLQWLVVKVVEEMALEEEEVGEEEG